MKCSACSTSRSRPSPSRCRRWKRPSSPSFTAYSIALSPGWYSVPSGWHDTTISSTSRYDTNFGGPVSGPLALHGNSGGSRRGPFMNKSNAGNMFTGMRSSSLIVSLFIGLIVTIVLLFANFTYLNVQAGYDTEYITHAGELRVLSQRIAKNATEAAAGKAEAFALLKDARNDFDRRWGYLTMGDLDTGLPMVSFQVAPQMDAVEKDWNRLRRDTDVILSSEQTVLSL